MRWRVRALSARDTLGRVVDYEIDNIDEHGLARGSVEIFAVRLCDGLVGPVFWYVIAGLPGVFVYCVTIALADARAHPTAKHAAFGGVAGALDRLMNLILAPVTAMLIVAGTLFAPTARPIAAIRGLYGGAASGQSPRAGWTRAPLPALLVCRCPDPVDMTTRLLPVHGSAMGVPAPIPPSLPVRCGFT
jgi:adenosylcobinamide-phosphate synthase